MELKASLPRGHHRSECLSVAGARRELERVVGQRQAVVVRHEPRDSCVGGAQVGVSGRGRGRVGRFSERRGVTGEAVARGLGTDACLHAAGNHHAGRESHERCREPGGCLYEGHHATSLVAGLERHEIAIVRARVCEPRPLDRA